MICVNPVLISISLAAAILLFSVVNPHNNIRTHIYSLIFFTASSMINPIFSHNGKTVIVFINDTPITFEAVIYGISASAMIVSLFYWFKILSQILTSDKLMYIFARFSPKLALLFSISLKFLPMLSRQYKNIKNTQKVLGIYKDNNIIDDIKGNISIFSALVTWAIENSLITADNMTARYYGLKKRSDFAIFKFRKQDIFITIILAVITILEIMLIKTAEIQYYPEIGFSGKGYIIYILYGIKVFIPSVMELWGNIRWKYLVSKI